MPSLLTVIRHALVVGALTMICASASHAQTLEPGASTSVFAGVAKEELPKEGTPSFALFAEAFYDNQLFLLGEAHGVARPQEVDFELFKHLNQRAGVRYYVGEFDCAKADYLNQYLHTGNDSTLQLVFRSWVQAESQWANKDLLNKFRKLRELNQTLPEKRRLEFVGIDEVQDLPLAADYLRYLLHKKGYSAVLFQKGDSLNALMRQPATSLLAAVARRTITELKLHPKSYRLSLGASYEPVLHLLKNLTYRADGLGREQSIFANFQALSQTKWRAGEKMYGMWGLAHVLQSPLQGGYSTFAAMVRQSSLPVHDKVVSVMCVFSGCEMLYPNSGLPAPWQTKGQVYGKTNKFNHDGPLTVIGGMEELKAQTTPGSTTLFRLDAPGAASTRQPIRVTYAPGIPATQQMQFDPKLPAAAYVQYLVLVRDSKAVQPLRP
ncbi:erythromycin esterase family protein [Hymenobacter cellulosivorans]|uniref:Erythromycin esterase family protein n=1 Tax=Hymenobacter cellulosivorans TaxID=2932249 RepID=A0ABY4F9X2_9BACT|nr:erythromycin esterase family protein [Hymenobacter cellulosivorans]UOQ53325.1 erythromycin esterase family protein [Hymenobacter cellulosivorans]